MAVLLAGGRTLASVRSGAALAGGGACFSAGGDFFLAMPWWKPSFVLGLGSFLVAHLCYLGALLPLRRSQSARAIAAAAMGAACVGLLIWFWPKLVPTD